MEREEIIDILLKRIECVQVNYTDHDFRGLTAIAEAVIALKKLGYDFNHRPNTGGR